MLYFLFKNLLAVFCWLPIAGCGDYYIYLVLVIYFSDHFLGEKVILTCHFYSLSILLSHLFCCVVCGF